MKAKRQSITGWIIFICAFFAIVIFSLLYFFIPSLSVLEYHVDIVSASTTPIQKPWVVTHIKIPEPVKGIYMTSWVAGSKALREGVVALVDSSEVNSIVIDIKDYSGRISFKTDNPILASAVENRIPDIRDFIESLHKKNIYVIGRIAVFQDPYMVKLHPEMAVKKGSNHAEVWKDYKGISWIDAGAEEYWQYIVELGKAAYAEGFDELNFDYIRFPSDGNMRDIYYPYSHGVVKPDVIENFFKYIHEGLDGRGIKMSADLFGMTATNSDDLNIGQVLERALPYFDAIAPMIYSSHYPTGFMGYKNPASMPYEVVKFSMDKAVERSSTTPGKIRPWLQDFNLGAIYTEAMVRAQKKAAYDAGATSWMMWNAASKYTKAAFDVDPEKALNQKSATTSSQ